MSEVSAIEWTEATWNPWHGCLKVSPGCAICYMYTEKKAYGQDPRVVVRSKTKFNDPLRWVRKGSPPRLCFTCSWSDFFIEQADAWRPEAWEIIRKTPQITYQILTKRIERAGSCLPPDWGEGYPNVWLGVSVENQKYADARIPLLLQTLAAVRWISAEPLLRPIDIHIHLGTDIDPSDDNREYPGLDWVVVGGESGPGARPMHPDWARSLRDQCQAAGVPFFFKQWGAWAPVPVGGSRTIGDPTRVHDWSGDGRVVSGRVPKKAAGRLLDGREWNEYPEIRA